MKFWKLAAITVSLALLKAIMDVENFRWMMSWLSNSELLNAWRTEAVPFDLWHVMGGLYALIVGAVLIYYYLKTKHWFIQLFAVERKSATWYHYKWSFYNWLVYGSLTTAWWLVYLEIFRLLYHWGLMRADYIDYWVF